MSNQINLEYLLSNFPSNENPFLALSNGLRQEIYGVAISSVEYPAAVVFTCLIALTCLGCLIGLGGKFYRGDRWFYKLQSTGLGSSLIVPNMVINYLFYSFIFSLTSIFYVLFSWIKVSSDLHSTPLLIAFNFIPLYFALIHVAWSSAASCYSHTVQLGRTVVTPKIFNIFFIGALTLVPLSLIPSTLVMNSRYNSGFDAYSTFNAALTSPDLKMVSVTSEIASAEAVRSLIPNTDALISQMVAGLYQFDDPSFEIGGSFALFTIIVMIIVTYYQTKSINVQLKSLDSLSTPVGESAGSRDADLRSLYKQVLVVCFTVCISMSAYLFAAIYGDEILSKSPVLQLPQSNGVFAALFLYFLSLVNVGAVGSILYQTFNPKRRSTNLTSFPTKSSSSHSTKLDTNVRNIPARSLSIDLHARRNSRTIEKGLERIGEADEEENVGEDLGSYLPPYPPTSPGFAPNYDIASYHLDAIADRKD